MQAIIDRFTTHPVFFIIVRSPQCVLRNRDGADDAPVGDIMERLNRASKLRTLVMSDFTPNDPSSTSTGTIKEINADTGKVTVEVNVFGRPTLADVNFAQIKLLVLRSGWAA
jgi:hypothetical protein